MNVLFGRDAETRELAGLVGKAAATGQALVMVGEPGIGKTALLHAATDLARAAGFQVLGATGVESETQFPFAGLHQVLRPVLGATDRLSAAHRRALLTAFGLADGPRPELYLIALAAAGLVGSAADDRPTAVLVDDVQWLDPQSQEVLTFMARRASRHRLVIIGAARTGYTGSYLAAGFTRFEVRGVDDQAADEILRVKAGVASPAERARVRGQAQGNPLALLELPIAGDAAPAGLASGIANGEQPALTARLESAFAGRLADLPPATRAAVLVAAVDPVGSASEVLAAAERLHGAELDAGVLDPAVQAGLILLDGDQLRFRHPLVRSGVLQAETLTRRQAAHAALASVLNGEPYRRTWHRAQSIVGPDDEIADELEANVQEALRRGAVMSAIADLQRSAQLTTSSARRGHRLLMAAEHAFGLGRADLVDELVTAASRTELTDLDWARVQWLREIFSDGVPGDATRVRELCAVARRALRAGDRDLALNLLLGAALRCWWADTGPAARALVVSALGEVSGLTGDPRYVAALAVAEPVLECGAVMDLLSGFRVADAADGDTLRLLGMAAHAIGDTVRSMDYLSRAEAVLREQGRLGLLSQVLSMQVVDSLELGDWTRAAAAADEGERLAHETGQPIWRAGTLVCDALNSAFRGEVEQAFTDAAEVEFLSSRQRLNDLLSCVQLARGAALVATGQYGTAYAELRRLFEPSDPSFHQRERFGGIMFLADAAVEAGEREDARIVIGGLEAVAAVTPSPMLHVHLRYARAVLADPQDASAAYADLMAADYARWPWAGARAELAYGSWLRREHRAAEALGPLQSAEAGFVRIGAANWAARARRERARALARHQ